MQQNGGAARAGLVGEVTIGEEEGWNRGEEGGNFDQPHVGKSRSKRAWRHLKGQLCTVPQSATTSTGDFAGAKSTTQGRIYSVDG